MPKKMGVNTKAEAARERRSAPEADRRDHDARAREEAYWQAAEWPKSRSACRREEESEKRAEATARRAENRHLTELEQQQRTAAEEEYERVVLVANTKRDDSIIEARSVDDAIAKMSIAAKPALPPDRHPERLLKV